MSDDTARPDSAAPSTGGTCPSCGVAVAAGYPKCPKCHAAMPGAAQLGRPAFIREGNVAGGTALESSSAMAWLAGGVALLLIGGGTIYFMSRGSGAKGKAKASARGPAVVAPKAFVPTRGQTNNPAETTPDASTGPSLSVRRSSASDALRDALNADQLWTELEYAPGDEATLILRTAYCADPKLRAVVGKLTPRLRGAAVTKVRCQARHGALVFSLDL